MNSTSKQHHREQVLFKRDEKREKGKKSKNSCQITMNFHYTLNLVHLSLKSIGQSSPLPNLFKRKLDEKEDSYEDTFTAV